MKYKKVRGHRRRWKHIDQWIAANKCLNAYYLQEHKRAYVKIRLAPWGNISITNSFIPQPRKKTKQKIILGLLSIYESWKHYLDSLGQPYYLKIWLFDPRFDQSQVVCAVNDYVHFYDETFCNPDSKEKFPFHSYSKLNNELSKYVWEYRLDEDYYDADEPGKPEHYASIKEYEASKKWFRKLLQKPHKTLRYNENQSESYVFKRGSVWLGA